jgi:MFS transporter, FSR family, fosmidomycin resistance protein
VKLFGSAMPPPVATAPLTSALPGPAATAAAAPVLAPQYMVILAISLCHMINDLMQSLLSALYPVLQAEFSLSYAQIGLMSLAFMGTASVLQPLVGLATDRRPVPLALPLGMGATLVGVLFLAFGSAYGWMVAGAGLVGLGSAVFHPEASRVARAAANGRFGTAQSFFQVGGNVGHSIGPLLAAFLVVPLGRVAVAAFALVALAGMGILTAVSRWHERHRRAAASRPAPRSQTSLPRGKVILSLWVLALLVLTKNSYTASMGSYYTFFLIDRFDLSTQAAQIYLFVYLGAAALGVFAGGMIADRIGTLTMIWISILGVLPMTLALPHVGLGATVALSVGIGFVMASAFPAIIVFAQELVPGRVGMIAGLFFGLAFGVGGIAAAALGVVADVRGIGFVFQLCALLPALGLVTILLPRSPRQMG